MRQRSNRDGRNVRRPKSNRRQAHKNKARPTDRRHKHNRTLNQGRACSLQATSAALGLGEQQGATAVHITLTLYKSHTEFQVGTSKNRPRGDIQRACRNNIAQGTNVPHDGLEKVPVHLDTDSHKSVTMVYIFRMCTVTRLHAPVMQSGSGTPRLGSGGSVGRAARVHHGDIQLGGTMGGGRVTSMSARTP
jgi:hypothetical protein